MPRLAKDQENNQTQETTLKVPFLNIAFETSKKIKIKNKMS